jgi:hypothetical protein
VHDAVAEATGRISAQPLRTGWKGVPLKKLDFDRGKRKGKENKMGKKGHGRREQNNSTQAESVSAEGVTTDGGKHGGGGIIDVRQTGNA